MGSAAHLVQQELFLPRQAGPAEHSTLEAVRAWFRRFGCLATLFQFGDSLVSLDWDYYYPALIHGDRFRDQKLSNVATHVETCTIIVLLMIFKYILTEPGIYKCE